MSLKKIKLKINNHKLKNVIFVKILHISYWSWGYREEREGLRVTTTGFYDCDYVILVYNFISKRDSNAVQNIRQIIAE